MLRCLSLAAIAALSTAAYAQVDTANAPAAPTLSIGDKAPKPDLMKVVKGDFAGKFEPKDVYVMEFWATWCGPCKTSMPHLSKLQKEYKDKGVTVVGVSDETVEKVTNFIGSGSWPEKTQYTIAVDDGRKTYKAYMTASGQRGIPTAFIVGKTGDIEWIGHPMRMDTPLAQVVDGSWDRAAAKAEFDKAVAYELKEQQAQQKLSKAYSEEDWNTMLEIFDEMKADAPADRKWFLDIQKVKLLLMAADEPKRAYVIAQTMVTNYGDNTAAMNDLAWTIATAPGLEDRNLDIALAAARAGVKASDGKDANVLDTLAVVLWEKGEKKEAIKTERKAVDVAENPNAKAEFEAKIAEWERELASAG